MRFLPSILKVLVPLLTVILLVSACHEPPAAGHPDDVDYYTCTMHPSVRSHDPNGKCPICSMPLVPVKKALPKATNNPSLSSPAAVLEEGAPAEFSIPIARQRQIGVTYAIIDKRPFWHTIRGLGEVTYDERRHWGYVSRVDGYIKQLGVFSRGEQVEKDTPLAEIYSPDLLTTQNEFVDLLKTRDAARTKGEKSLLDGAERLVEAARQRLRLWNIGDAQIDNLEKTRVPLESLTLRSPFRGVIQDLAIVQGRKVTAGERLVDVADLSAVWVWVQLFQDELPMMKPGLPVAISSSSYPGENFDGKISLLDPFMNESLRTGRVRVDVNNAGLKLRPGMYVDAEVTMDMGQSVAVPVAAVLPTGKHNIVFVSKGEGRLEPRYIQIGRQYGGYYEAPGGLKEGEQVVTSANFLIDAEAQIQGVLRTW